MQMQERKRGGLSSMPKSRQGRKPATQAGGDRFAGRRERYRRMLKNKKEKQMPLLAKKLCRLLFSTKN
jgi:hypothetical protein